MNIEGSIDNMDNKKLAIEIAKGLIETGIEGGYGNVCCSTAGDYPSVGVSSWEGNRADILLSYIDGGDKFAGRTYSDLEESGEIEELSELLDSEQGQEAQLMILSDDTEMYVEAVKEAGLTDEQCIVYAGMWCPTSHYVVSNFIESRDIDINNIDSLHEEFRENYADYADCSEYAEGYANRADNTYEYVTNNM